MSFLGGAIILFCRKIHRLFPGILIAAVVGILVAYWSGYKNPIVGPIASEGIGFSLDLPWNYLPQIVFSGIIIAIVGFAEPASISLALTREAGIQWNASRELLGSGIANFTSGLVGGYPIGGSFSRTSINQVAGSTTSWSGFITGLIVLGFLPFIHLLQYLPKSTLAVIITLAVMRLIKVREMVAMFRLSQIWGGVSFLTMVATLIAAPRIEYGIVFGVVVSLIAGTFVKPSQEDIDG